MTARYSLCKNLHNSCVKPVQNYAKYLITIHNKMCVRYGTDVRPIRN